MVIDLWAISISFIETCVARSHILLQEVNAECRGLQKPSFYKAELTTDMNDLAQWKAGNLVPYQRFCNDLITV